MTADERTRPMSIFDIVYTGKDSRIKITEERGTRAMVSRKTLEAIGTHKGREADDGKAPKGVGTDVQAERPCLI